MRIRTLLPGFIVGAALLAGGIAAPAQAVPETTTTTAASASSAAPGQASAPAATGWTYALSSGSPVRAGYSSSSTVLWRTSSAGQSLHYYSTKVNSAGNLWYQLDSPYWGWVYCGNIAAPC